MEPSEFADRMRAGMLAVRACKQDMCARERGPADLMLQVCVQMEGEDRPYLALVPERDLILTGVLAWADEGKRIDYIEVAADAYRASVEVAAGAEPQRGAAARAFAEGDLSVTETLVVTAIDVKRGQCVSLQLGYRYGDDGQPAFDDEPTLQHDPQGAIADLLRLAAAAVR